MTLTQSEAAAIPQTEEEWREKLTPMQYHVAREAGTERAFSGEYWNTKDAGTYMCVGCGIPLFRSETKYDSGTGWPSFYESVDGASRWRSATTTATAWCAPRWCAVIASHIWGTSFPTAHSRPASAFA